MDVYKIAGLDDCIKCIDAAPGNVMKMTRNAMKDAGKATARVIRSRTPARFRRIVGYKVTKGQLSGNTYALVGYFNKANPKQSDKEIPDWFKAYWKNYGTLAKRDRSHHFKYPVKPDNTTAAKSRRNKVGQRHENFFEAAIGGWNETFYRTFEESMKKQENTLYDR